ncbi:MAG: potassium transporter Kup [Gemmatimonadetes bacterium]|nr:potassium transporter Kup [Gemmatimonadota bacterium]
MATDEGNPAPASPTPDQTDPAGANHARASSAAPAVPGGGTPTPVGGTTAAFPVPAPRPHVDPNPTGRRLGLLMLTALGIVYGDIGTSPLYAFRESFRPEHALTASPDHVFGVLSLIVWSLMIVVTIKYIMFVMRADNRGEGGILALLALITSRDTTHPYRRAVLISVALIGAALLYGDGTITPAMSVLSAVEGLAVVTPALHAAIVPLTVVIIAGLFFFQRHGTARVGALFGPVMLLWFGTLAALGVREMLVSPQVLAALNPLHGVRLIEEQGLRAFGLMGSVVLAVTGAEALVADMGHFGKRPIRLAWFYLVFPCLLLNYFGQGALVLRDPSTVTNPFYLLAPEAFRPALLVLATAAAVIASQAMISGAFSVTQQCVQLGYSPRVTIVHTSAREFGQVYIPEVNWALAVGCILVVLGFRSSSSLGAAYGIAVTGTFTCTTILFVVIAAARWDWPRWRVFALAVLFLTVDVAFFGANLLKVAHGGWVPLVIAIAIYGMMTTWKRGRDILRARLREIGMPLTAFLESFNRDKSTPRVRGTAVFMTSEAAGTPVVLLHHLKHNKVLHEQVILLSIQTGEVPYMADGERIASLERHDQGFVRVVARYGFMESPDVKEILGVLRSRGIKTKPLDTSYYLGREELIPTAKKWKSGSVTMNIWRKRLFALMARNARSAAAFFQLPPNRVVELGTQIEF